MSGIFDTLLLFALPASGKSEVRRYLNHLTPEQCRNEFHMGPTVQLDDYPYVHMMRRISQELRRRGADPVFFADDEHPMKQPLDWGTLVEILNEDYDDMVARRRHEPASAAQWLFDRYDRAREKVGAKPGLSALPAKVRTEVGDALEREAAELLEEKNENLPDTLQGRTVVIEAARGGPDKATLPLPAPLGYRYSISRFSDAILEKAVVLYVWVTPEESRRKNIERADPNNPGSILAHGVPMPVMLGDYGCDDMEWLVQNSDRPDTIRLEVRGRVRYLPVGRFDNRADKTTFVRSDRKLWKKEQIDALHNGLADTLSRMAAAHR